MKLATARVLFVFISTSICSFVGFFIGMESKETEIEIRANEIQKQSYTNTDIEFIIFGEPQK